MVFRSLVDGPQEVRRGATLRPMAAIIETGYTCVRDDYRTAHYSGAVAECVPETETVILDGGEWFQAWRPLDPLAYWMVYRMLHYRGGRWPSRMDRGYRVVQLEFLHDADSPLAPDDVFGKQPLLVRPELPPVYAPHWKLTRADVIAELDYGAVTDVFPDPLGSYPLADFVNYSGARNSMGELILIEP